MVKTYIHLNRWSDNPTFRCSSRQQCRRKHKIFLLIFILIFLIPMHRELSHSEFGPAQIDFRKTALGSLSLSANQKQKVNVWKPWAMTKSKLSISLVNSLIGANRSFPYIFLFLYVFCTAVTLSLLPMKDSIFEFYVNFFSVFISLFLLWLVRSTSVRLLTE